MNVLQSTKRSQVVAALVEGASINATCRMTGVAKHTVLNLLRDMGCACAAYHDKRVRHLRVRRIQCDEIWSFVYGKQKNVTPEHERNTLFSQTLYGVLQPLEIAFRNSIHQVMTGHTGHADCVQTV